MLAKSAGQVASRSEVYKQSVLSVKARDPLDATKMIIGWSDDPTANCHRSQLTIRPAEHPTTRTYRIADLTELLIVPNCRYAFTGSLLPSTMTTSA
jgi:hypothetical protein